MRTDQPGKCSKCAPTFWCKIVFSKQYYRKCQQIKISLEEIQKIVSLRGVEPAASIRKRFGIGTSLVYKIWKKAEKERSAEEEEATAKKSAAEEAEEDRGLAAVLSSVELLQEKMDLLLEGQEIHFEDVEDLEEKVGEAQKDILANIKEGSNALREKTERIASAANAAKAAVYSLFEVVGIVSTLGFTVWLLSLLARNPQTQELARKKEI